MRVRRARFAEFFIVTACAAAFFAVLFSPVLTRHLILGDGADQLVETLCYYLGPRDAWNGLTMLGYPTFANPSGFWWYPLRLLAVFGPLSYNVYELSAFVIAFAGAYYLVRTLTGNRVSGIIGALVYSASGFMISHVGHVMIVYPAAWVPAIALAAVRLRARFDWFTIAWGALSIACCLGTGQPQMALFALYLVLAMSLARGRSSAYGFGRYLGAVAIMTGFGCALAAVVLVPLLAVVPYTARAHNGFIAFNSFATPPLQLPLRLLFPYVFGRTIAAPYTMSNYDLGGFFELTNYVGLATLAFAGIATGWIRRHADVAFFAAVAIVALLLTTGDALGLAHLTHWLPGFAAFREPSRHAMEFTLAMAVLAGFGWRRIVESAYDAKMVSIACAGLASFAVVAAVALALAQPFFQRSLIVNGAPAGIRFSPLDDAAEWIPFVILAITAASLVLTTRVPRRFAPVFAVAPLVLDLVVFASASYWNYGAFSPALLAQPPYADRVRAFTLETHTRALTLPGPDVRAGIPPDLNVLWGIPEARGYTPLALATARAFDPAHPLDPTQLARTAVSVVIVPPARESTQSIATLRARHWRVLYAATDATVLVDPHPPSRAWISSPPDGSVRVQPDDTFTVRCARRCRVVTSDAFYPGWTATVDGAKVTVDHADGLRAVWVPAGRHELRFAFRPLRLWVGAAVSCAALLLLVTLALLSRLPLDRREVAVG